MFWSYLLPGGVPLLVHPVLTRGIALIAGSRGHALSRRGRRVSGVGCRLSAVATLSERGFESQSGPGPGPGHHEGIWSHSSTNLKAGSHLLLLLGVVGSILLRLLCQRPLSAPCLPPHDGEARKSDARRPGMLQDQQQTDCNLRDV